MLKTARVGSERSRIRGICSNHDTSNGRIVVDPGLIWTLQCFLRSNFPAQSRRPPLTSIQHGFTNKPQEFLIFKFGPAAASLSCQYQIKTRYKSNQLATRAWFESCIYRYTLSSTIRQASRQLPTIGERLSFPPEGLCSFDVVSRCGSLVDEPFWNDLFAGPFAIS